MVAQGAGTILNVTSGALLGILEHSLYGATKGAVMSLTYGWAMDAAPHGVRVNALSPLARTAMSEAWANRDAEHMDEPPPASVAPLVAYLLSDHAAGITGQVVRLDATGLSLMAPPAFPDVGPGRPFGRGGAARVRRRPSRRGRARRLRPRAPDGRLTAVGVRLDEDETWAFLAASHTGILSTVRADGSPAVVPMWFVAFDRAVVRPHTRAPRRRPGHVRRDPRVCFLVESGKAWAELKAVVLHGTADVVEDPGLRGRIDALFDEKYAGHRTPATVPEATKRHYAAPRAHIRIVERGRPLTWDNARLLG